MWYYSHNKDLKSSLRPCTQTGQPNVGKSSLLNALFGTHKVKASKTPGKVSSSSSATYMHALLIAFIIQTKHFQTLFWTSEVRLVDCPGLVIPNFVPMEMQVTHDLTDYASQSLNIVCRHSAESSPFLACLQFLYAFTLPRSCCHSSAYTRWSTHHSPRLKLCLKTSGRGATGRASMLPRQPRRPRGPRWTS